MVYRLQLIINCPACSSIDLKELEDFRRSSLRGYLSFPNYNDVNNKFKCLTCSYVFEFAYTGESEQYAVWNESLKEHWNK